MLENLQIDKLLLNILKQEKIVNSLIKLYLLKINHPKKKKTMKHFFKLTILASVVTALIFGLSAFTSEKSVNVNRYQINLMSKTIDGVNETWTWSLSNPNPGNGDNETLQDVSHLSFPLTPQAEAALISADYSYDGITWISNPLSIDRDPTIKACTSVDVLKFDVGTTGTAPLYYRVTFNDEFESSPYATCYIKTGGGRNGCNTYYFTGISTPKLD